MLGFFKNLLLKNDKNKKNSDNIQNDSNNNHSNTTNNNSSSFDNFFSYEPVLMKNYQIKGINKMTNRKKTVTVSAKNEELAEKAALDQGILPPYEIEIIFTPPTERQIEYAKSLKINIPEKASSLDVSYLISRKTDRDSDPNPGLLEYADNRNLLFSKYIGKQSLYNLIFNTLTDEDKIAFFAFCVYRWLSDDRHANLDTHQNKNVFYEFAKSMVNDESFVKSMNKYEGKDLRFFGKFTIKKGNSESTIHGGSTNTIAYKKTSEFISNRFNTPIKRTKTFLNE